MAAAGSGTVVIPPEIPAEGWATAIPDFEGPKSAFMAGPESGHAVLDGIRAVRQFTPAGIGPANPWALTGYSGGAAATGWAAQLQPYYAPDVRFVGVALGGTPADPAAVARSLDGGPFAGFEYAATWGIDQDYPESRITSILNTQGITDFDAAGGQCISALVKLFPFKRIESDSTVPDPISFPTVAAVLWENTLGHFAPASAPIYDYHADTDEIVPVAQDNTLVRDWCSEGATIQVTRDLIGEHGLEANVRAASVMKFLEDRFAGDRPVDGC
jgi:hypothetical protein